MKRELIHLRRVLLEAEAGHAVYSDAADPVLYHHARRLLEEYATVRVGDNVAFVGALSPAGRQLLDEMRDEGRLTAAQDAVEAQGMDRDNLAAVRAVLASSRRS